MLTNIKKYCVGFPILLTAKGDEAKGKT